MPDDLEREMGMSPFESAALKISTIVCRENPDVNIVFVWDYVEARLSKQRSKSHSTVRYGQCSGKNKPVRE